jgi:DNA-binding response OmpR family regulator
MQDVVESFKILVVEDEADIRQVLCFFLRQSGYNVLDVAGGQEAIRVVPEYCPHLIILDLMMHPMSGWDVLQWLHTTYQHSLPPVIIMTALVQFSDQIRGFEEGAVEYITKPVQPNKVVERVRMLLSLTVEQRVLLQRERIEDQQKTLERLYAPQPDEFVY